MKNCVGFFYHAIRLSAFVVILLFSVNCEDASQRSRRGTVFIGIRADFDSLNELNAADTDALQVIKYMLFMPLTRLDQDLNFEPYLAEKWELSENNRAVTFFLRKDVRWTDGRQTTAKDVLFTYDIATNPEVAYPAASRFDLVDRVVLVDDYTVRFELKKAYPDVLYDLQMPILPAHILESLSPENLLTTPFNRQPIGNGPFILAEWKANESIVFTANQEFPLGPPKLDRVVFSVIPDESILLTNLQAGTVDLVPRLTPENVRQLKSSEITIRSFPGRIFTFVGWNLDRPILSRPVRRAFTHAISKKEIIETLLQGYGKPAIGPLTPMAWAYNEKQQDVPYDPAKAGELLSREGWIDRNGDGIRDKSADPLEITIKVNSASRLRQDVAVLIQAQLKKIGVRVRIQQLEWNVFIDQVFQESDFDGVILAWDTDFTVNPTDLWHSDAIKNGYNFVSYDNVRIDELLELGRNAANRETAQPYWDEFQQTIINDCPYTFLFIQDNIVAFNDRLQGCVFDLRSLLVNIHDWWTL